MYILALESSTTSAKAMVYDTDNGTFEVRARAYELANADVSVHDAASVFEQTMELGKTLCAGRNIDMISLGGTWHSLMLCDKDMQPKTPVYLWSYVGAAGICKKLREDSTYVDWFYNKTGCMVNAIYPTFKIKLLEEQGYNLKDYLFVGQGTYNTYRLTGQRVVTDSMASGTGLLNIHNKEFDTEILKHLGIEKNQLPKLITYKDELTLTAEGAKILGLKAGIPVIATGPDGGLNQVGAGAIQDGVMSFSAGTSGAIRVSTAKPVIPKTPSTWCYLSPKMWLSGAAVSGCCNCIDWFLQKNAAKGVTYEMLEAGYKQNTPTPVFLPFLFGERCPGWDDERTAAFFDILPQHTIYDLYRGLQEGILFNIYQCYEVLIKLNGKPKKIKLSGGILNSKIWLQMCADIFGEPMEVDKSEHSSLLGSVALALERLDIISDAADFNTGASKTILPNNDMADIYAKKYNRYKHWYNKTK